MTHRSDLPRILFVSKAVAPPFRDGASVLVRDLSRALSRTAPTVLATSDSPPPGPNVDVLRIYRRRSRYAPALADNVRVLAHLARDHAHDIWHFVFAPNPVSSHAGRILRTLRRRKTVQTIASRPRDFARAPGLLFGDRVIALSQHTADRLVQAGCRAASIDVIPPPIDDLQRTPEQRNEARRRAGIDLDVPLFIYAGDLEFSKGADRMAACSPRVLDEVPDSVVAFACRAKTPRAAQRRDALASSLSTYRDRVRFLGEVEDLPSLIASATALPFPVEDLYGKVDLPYVVLEAALLEVPVLVVKGTPLEEIEGIAVMDSSASQPIVDFCVEMARDERARRQLGQQLRASVLSANAPSRVAARVESIYLELMR